MIMHENGAYYVMYGSIFSRYNEGFMIDEDATILIDTAAGALLKVGKKGAVTSYFNKMTEGYKAVGVVNDDLCLITFHVKYPELDFEPEGYNFDIDEICTIINYFNDSIGPELMNEFVNSGIDAMKARVKELQDMGF